MAIGIGVGLEASFNPYFTGSNSGSFYVFLEIHFLRLVSILILLEVILEVLEHTQFRR